MRIALDTNAYADVCRGDEHHVAVVEQALDVFLPFVVLAELRAGFSLGRRRADNERILAKFLRQPGVHVLLADEDTTHRYAATFRQLRQQGTPIPTNDIWIAALALQHDLALLSRDTHFDHLPHVRRA